MAPFLCKDGLLSGGMVFYLKGTPFVTYTNSSSMTTLLDHKTTLAYLAYLGYPQTQPSLPSPSSSFASSSSAPSLSTATPSTTTALQVTRPRRTDRKKGKVTRNVFLCYVCGAAGSGKTTLLRAFSGKKYNGSYEPTSKPISVVNSVEIGGVEKYLVVSRMYMRWSPLKANGGYDSFRSLGPIMRRRRCATPRRWIWQM